MRRDPTTGELVRGMKRFYHRRTLIWLNRTGDSVILYRDEMESLVTMVETNQNDINSWWRNFELPSGFLQNLQIGPTKLQISHLEREWRIAASRVDESLSGDSLNQVILDPPVPVIPSAAAPVFTANAPAAGNRTSNLDGDIKRYASRRTGAGFRLVPVMADRPVVCRPLNQIFVLPGDHVELFVSTPVWINVFLDTTASSTSSGQGEGTHVAEIPTVRLTDTWIGSSTVEGELGYSALTKARLSYQDVVFRPHMVTTGVVIRNLALQPLRLDRISLPAPYLHIYATSGGALCTEGVLLEHKEGGQFAELEIMRHPLGPTEACSIAGRSRRDVIDHTVVRAFSSFLSRRESSL
ncbi:MAG: hypothetical protein EBU49_09480 [Proteobacteria bacterium]|nr:hypothetical protein [Pseudomonadota bacterium]